MTIDKSECTSRTLQMMADFLHREPAEILLKDRLRSDWSLNDKDLEVLEIWIEGPISASNPGFFQDVAADVRTADLQKDSVVTIKDLAALIWKNIPAAHRDE
jgi:hypothetical protein